MHQGEGYVTVKVKYLHSVKFYVAHTLCKRLLLWNDNDVSLG